MALGALRYSWVKTSGGAAPARYAYDEPSRTFTFIPRSPLAVDTRYTLTVKVQEPSGALGRPYAVSFTTRGADLTAPAAPGAPVAGAVSAASAELTWPPATDDVAVTEYQVFNGSDPTPLATVTGAPPEPGTTLTGLAPATAYSLTVRAKDAAGNVSPPSAALAVTTAAIPDTTAPTAPGTPVASAVTATSATPAWPPSTDAVGVTGYRVTGGPAEITTATAGTTLTGLTAETTYTVSVTAVDAAGNASGPSAPVVFTTPALVLANGVSGAGIPGSTGRTLVLYDSTGPFGFLGELYAMAAVNLASHFGSWTAQPVGDYTAGELDGFSALVYIGSTYDEPLPLALLDDVTATTKPVVWMYDNIWQLTARDPSFAATRGFTWTGFDFSPVSKVDYKGRSFSRNLLNNGGIMGTSITDPAKVSVVAEAVRGDGTTFPWGVRSGNFTYLGEIPFSYMSTNDRYLAYSDMLFDVLAPATAQRHRALVRIEDVGPDADPAELRAITDYLYSRNIPFSVAVYPRYVDPKGKRTAVCRRTTPSLSGRRWSLSSSTWSRTAGRC